MVERCASWVAFLTPLLAAFPAINTVVMLFAQLFAYADAPGGGGACLHDELIGCDEMPEGKQPMACGGARRGCGRGPRARATRSGSPRSGWQGCAKSATTRCAVRWRTRSPGSRSSRATETGRGLTTSPVGNDHSIDTVGYAMMDDSCMGENAASSFSPPSKGAKG